MNVKQTVQDAADAVAEQMQERRADMKFDARLKAIEKNLGNVDNRIDALGKRFPRRQGPRFPLGLVVIAGVGYALYNPSTRSRILEMLGNVSPAARDTVENAIGKTSDAVAEVQGGRDMASAVKDAARDTVQKTRTCRRMSRTTCSAVWTDCPTGRRPPPATSSRT